MKGCFGANLTPTNSGEIKQQIEFDYAQFTGSSTFLGLSPRGCPPPPSTAQQPVRAGTLEIAAKCFLVDSANISQEVRKEEPA